MCGEAKVQTKKLRKLQRLYPRYITMKLPKIKVWEMSGILKETIPTSDTALGQQGLPPKSLSQGGEDETFFNSLRTDSIEPCDHLK